MGVLDAASEEYLTSVSEEIGIRFSLCDQQLKDVLTEDLSSYETVGGDGWNSDENPVVHQLPAADINHILESVKSDHRCGGQWGYLVEHPSSEFVSSFGFCSVPSEQDIDIARAITVIRYWIESDIVCQQFNCKICGRENHWTETECRSSERPENIFDRALMLRNNVCMYDELAVCCQLDGLGLKPTHRRPAGP